MIPDQCSFCKGKLVLGKTEFMARAGNEVVVIKDVPAWVCEQCGESYFTAAISRKIDAIMRDAHQGKLCVRPLAAGEVDLEA
jgi:YgiT-type zinc finger domain-containing protein